GQSIVAESTFFSPQPQISMVIMDQKTGYVKAISGGRGQKMASRTLNRATGTYRQPGSTFKVVAAYAAAIDDFGKTISSTYEDEPYAYSNGREVHNWLTNTYQGTVSIRQAIANSINVAAVKCITEITPQVAYKKLLDFGFTSLDPEHDINQPLALGGIYRGVSNLELTAAYASIANQGTYNQPIFYTCIRNMDGDVILENDADTHRVLKEGTAFQLTLAMQDVISYGTGGALALPCGMPVAGKTGTTSAYNDVWFVGYTPYYTCGIWAGYDNNEKLGGDERNYHKTIWRNVMNALASELPIIQFDRPEGVVSAWVCDDTGMIPNEFCPGMHEAFFTPDTLPQSVCSLHQPPPPPVESLVESITDDSDSSGELDYGTSSESSSEAPVEPPSSDPAPPSSEDPPPPPENSPEATAEMPY
ncbi:MAG: glycosyl transferase, partial [Lachnospiraceae bacterium]|nr:glycosyl transferase [Candidatus Equihabitans merdae]